MVSKTVKIRPEIGLHLRPAGILCKKAIDYPCRIELHYGHTQANAKSVLSVLSACVKGGSEVTLFCDGPEEEKALEELANLIENELE